MKRIFLFSAACASCATVLSATGSYRAIGPQLLNNVKMRNVDPPISGGCIAGLTTHEQRNTRSVSTLTSSFAQLSLI